MDKQLQEYGVDRLRPAISLLRGYRRALAECLSDGDWHSNLELSKIGGLSYNAALTRLRAQGFVIETRHRSGGVWEHRLVGLTASESASGEKELSRPQQRVATAYVVAIEREWGKNGTERVHAHLPTWLKEEDQ